MVPIPTSADGTDLWVFAYASLMWKPDFEHTEVRDAVLRGYSRRLCIYSHQYRGTPECPGLVFGLDRGGSCRGRVLRVASKNVDSVIAYLYEREMINKVYHPRMVKTEVDAQKVQSLAFIADRDHQQYAGALEKKDAVKLIKQGIGHGGRCIEYLMNTAEHLRELGIHDSHLEGLLRAVSEADNEQHH